MFVCVCERVVGSWVGIQWVSFLGGGWRGSV